MPARTRPTPASLANELLPFRKNTPREKADRLQSQDNDVGDSRLLISHGDSLQTGPDRKEIVSSLFFLKPDPKVIVGCSSPPKNQGQTADAGWLVAKKELGVVVLPAGICIPMVASVMVLPVMVIRMEAD